MTRCRKWPMVFGGGTKVTWSSWRLVVLVGAGRNGKRRASRRDQRQDVQSPYVQPQGRVLPHTWTIRLLSSLTFD